MDKLGTITFQSNDRADVFYVTDVYENGVEPSDESFVGIPPVDFESANAWVNGRVPSMKPVHVDGETTILHGWFKGGSYERHYRLTIYVEYELAEEVFPDGAEDMERRREIDDSLAPQEINL
ncbi:hypothetical protein [Parachryseolinea silvisoli]|uniref:hypothetical protein n=1 Tax=Parachryseolinea silvisoli TaxID=2873601 RepID=UPI002265DCA2|nr:hypothetical protein [Parachryseolinea silvisoli]MCD9019136.1 hypothetical protein [Parachryseolinea silvisoli]